jgi:hypothetical protein
VTVADITVYRRLLFNLQPGGIDRAAFRAAADLARLLNVEMLAIFVEDQSVVGAANLPFARELRLPTHDWHPVSSERLALELQVAAEQARLQLVQESAAVGIDCRFEVRRGDPATTVVRLCSLHDIIAVTEPSDAIDRLTGTADRLRQAALLSEATVLLLPPHSDRFSGPVIAIIADATDPGLVVAARIAISSQGGLLVLAAADDSQAIESMRRVAGETGLSPERLEMLPFGGRTVDSAIQALSGRRARCLVMSRNLAGLPSSAPERLSAELAVPVLVIEPSPAAAA